MRHQILISCRFTHQGDATRNLSQQCLRSMGLQLKLLLNVIYEFGDENKEWKMENDRL